MCENVGDTTAANEEICVTGDFVLRMISRAFCPGLGRAAWKGRKKGPKILMYPPPSIVPFNEHKDARALWTQKLEENTADDINLSAGRLISLNCYREIAR